MDGLIPLLIRYAAKKQTKAHGHGHGLHRSQSENSSTGRSYHLLLAAGDSVEGSSHRRTRSDFQLPTPRGEYGNMAAATPAPANAENGFRQRSAFAPATRHKVGGRNY